MAFLGALLLAIAVVKASEEDKLKIPVLVDQSGKQIYFVVDSGSDVPAEAAKFCAAHLPSTDSDECRAQLTARVAETRDAQFEAQHALPGISFSVRNHDGDTLRFVHEEGASPVAEAREFCRDHFEQVTSARAALLHVPNRPHTKRTTLAQLQCQLALPQTNTWSRGAAYER